MKLFNFSNTTYNIKSGDRVCQITLKYSLVDFAVEWGRVVESDRGGNGFGSTGK